MNDGTPGELLANTLTVWESVADEKIEQPTDEHEFKRKSEELGDHIADYAYCQGNKPIDELSGEAIANPCKSLIHVC